jgi:protein farnesyltransferase subunit beta
MTATGESTRSPTSRLEEILSSADRIEELSDTDNEYEDMGVITGPHEMANIEYINSVTQPIRDAFSTKTSEVQDQTLEALLPFLEGNPDDFPLNSHGLPQLQRQKHIEYLKKSLGNFPAQFSALDAARPWLVYWSLQGLTAMGYDITEYQQR